MNSYLEYLRDLTERSKQGDAVALLQLRQELRMPLRVQARMQARRESDHSNRGRDDGFAEGWRVISGTARDFCATTRRGDHPSWSPDGGCDTILV